MAILGEDTKKIVNFGEITHKVHTTAELNMYSPNKTPNQTTNNKMYKSMAFFAAVILALVCSACSGGKNETAVELLGTVPAKSGAVVVLDMSQIVENCGGKVKEGKVEKQPDIAGIGVTLNEDVMEDAITKWMLNGENGVECSSVVLFNDGPRDVTTLFLSDIEAFEKAVAEKARMEWTSDAPNASHIGEIYRIDRQVWLGSGLDAQTVKEYSELSAVRSFAGNDYAQQLVADDAPIHALATVNALTGDLAGLGFSERTTARLLVGMAFDDAKYLAFSGDVNRERIAGEVTVLNSKWKPSKCELKLSEIDPATVERLGGNANFVMALGVSQSLIKQIMEAASSMGGAMPAEFASAITPIEGTVAVGANNAASPMSLSDDAAMRMVVPTSGKENAVLGQLMGADGNLDIEGNTFILTHGDYGKGALNVKSAAQRLKGSYAGVVMTMNQEKLGEGTFLLKPNGSSVKLSIELKLKN